MEKYVVLYLAPVESIEKMMASMTPEQSKAGMDEWGKWLNDRKEHFVDMGAPLGKTKRVTDSGVTDVKNEVTGYSIVQAESHEEAAKLFQDLPHSQLPGAYVEVIRIANMGQVS